MSEAAQLRNAHASAVELAERTRRAAQGIRAETLRAQQMIAEARALLAATPVVSVLPYAEREPAE